jgi:multiple sugar transport system substrate-binding protein
VRGSHDRSGGGRGGRPAKKHRMRIRPPSPPRRAVAALAVALLALAMACTPGGSNDSKSSSSGPVTLKLQANAVKGGKNATEATWLQDWVIPNFQKMMSDQGKQVTVQYVGTGADDEDVKTQLALDLRTGAGPDVFTPDGPWVGEFAQAGFLKPLDQVVGSEVNGWDGWSQIPKPVAGIVEFEGKRYGIPVGTDGRVLFFNKKLFAKAGLPTDWQPKSWDEVLQAGRQLKAKLPEPGRRRQVARRHPRDPGRARLLLPALRPGPGRPQAPAARPLLRPVRRQQDRRAAGGRLLLAQRHQPRRRPGPMKDRDQAIGWALIPARQPGGGLNGQDFVSLSGGAGRVINPNTKSPRKPGSCSSS